MSIFVACYANENLGSVLMATIPCPCNILLLRRNERSPRGYPNRSGVKLKGPSSSYETSFYSMMGSVHSARIQPDSVNCITINNEPQDKHLRLMVAAHVTLNPTGSTYIARDTTLLPPIPGLPHLMCLLFSPTVEMR